MLETQIARLRETIKSANVISSEEKIGFVQIGSRIKIKEGKQQKKIEIVDGSEADPAAGKISSESPMGAAFLNKREGDTTTVKTPSGEKEFKIIKIY